MDGIRLGRFLYDYMAYGSFVDAGLYVGQNYKIKNAGGTVISSGTIAYVDALLIDLTETGGTGLSAGTLNSNEKIFCRVS